MGAWVVSQQANLDWDPMCSSATEPPESARISQNRVVAAPTLVWRNNLALTLINNPNLALIGQTQALHSTHPVLA